MGTISDKLMRIINTKEDIRQALILKGYDVPTSIPFKEYAKMISDLPCKVDDFPKLPGDVTRWHFGGLTNEMMAAMDDPRIEDADHKGRFLSFKNFAWKGMSGVGGYADNFANWSLLTDRADAKITTNSFFISSVKKSSNSAILRYSKVGEIVPSIRIKVSGLIDGMGFVYIDSLTNIILHISKDGIYTLPSYTIESGVSYTSIKFDKIQESCNITIEQLPLYPGALVFDGVDDYGTCDNFPILTKEKGYTVVALRQYITRNEGPLGLVSNIENWFKDGAFLLEFREIAVSQFNRPISFGAVGKERDLPCVLTYQTSKSYNGVSIEAGNFTGTDVLHVGKLSPKLAGYCNAAIWELVFLDHDATEEELTKIKDYFVKTYPWLFPDQAWTVTGKTNEDEDRATIANITGNGNDLVLSNFGFAEGSGYGLYAENYAGGRWVQSTDRADLTWTSYSVNITSVKVASTQLYYQSYPEQPSFTVPSYKIKVYGLKDGQTLSYKQVTSEGQQIYKISEDGIYTLPSFLFKANGDWYGFALDKIQETCDITIEQIPEYEGYLITDGVDDKVVSAESIAFTDTWTIITDTVFLGKVSVASGILASNIFTVYNYQGSGTIAVAMGEGGSSLRVITSSIKAFSSDGTIYDAEWNEYHVEIGTIRALERLLKIGTSSNEKSYFCQLAFKFLGIYNNQILSKDDCIKAYNYLQTIKSK